MSTRPKSAGSTIKARSPRAAWRHARHPVALFANGGIGDHLIAVPALQALAKIFPGRLQLICRQGLGQVFFGGLPLRKLCDDLTWRQDGISRVDPGRFLKKIPQCDLFIMADTWHLPAIDWLLQSYSPAHSIGFGAQFQHCLRSFKSNHRMDVLFEVARTISPSLRLETFARPPASFVTAARRFRRMMPRGRRALGVHTQTKESKTWPWSHWEGFLREFLSRHPNFLVFILGQGDFRRKARQLGPRVIPCPPLSLPHALSFVGALDFFVGVDSCMLHSADLFRIPGVGLFGDTNPAVWGFRLAPHRHLYGGGQLSLIQPDRVLDALESLM